jgi:hypothetical protein
MSIDIGGGLTGSGGMASASRGGCCESIMPDQNNADDPFRPEIVRHDIDRRRYLI